jgi:hypothetical protein
MEKNSVPTLTIIMNVLLALCSGLIGAIVGAYVSSIPAYEQIAALRSQTEIMRQSLEKRAKLTMTVIPSRDFQMTMEANGTFKIRNATLTLSKSQNYTFTVYVANTGEAFCHLLYYLVIWNFSPNSEKAPTVSSYYTLTTTLDPSESTSFDYKFHPSEISSQMLGPAENCTVTFVLGSAEASVNQTILAHFDPFAS